MKHIKSVVCTVAIGLILVAQLMRPVMAYADGDITSTPTDTVAVTSTPVPTSTPTEIIPSETLTPLASVSPTYVPVETGTPIPLTDTPIPTATEEPITATVIPVDTDSPTTESLQTETLDPSLLLTPEPVETAIPADASIEAPTLLEAVQELPGNNSVVVLNENGQPLSLASQAAADIVATSDPMWCPDGVAPGGLGCTGSYYNMNDLLTYEGVYINSQTVNGTIWITSGYVGDYYSIVIDGTTYTNWANYTLTLQGGWSGLYGDTSIGSNSVFYVPIGVYNWSNDLNVNNITVNYANLSGVAAALDLVQNVSANINITNTVIENNSGTGLNTSNSGTVNVANTTIRGNYGNGANIYSGNATIDNSTFYWNYGDGAYIYSGGNATISNSYFAENYSNGANIYSGNATIDNSAFYWNYGDGAYIYSGGNATIDNSIFNYNGYSGLHAYLNNATISNSDFSGNYYDGADIFSTDGVTIAGSTFDWNYGTGAFIYSGGNATIGNSYFAENYGNGANIYSGNATIDNSIFNYNGYSGLYAYLNNATISNSDFSGNYYDGAYIYSGNTTIHNSNFSGNGWEGASITSTDDVNIDSSTFSQNYSGAGINTSGNVNISNSDFSSNGYDGLDVFANGGSIDIQDSTFNNNNQIGCDGYGAWLVGAGNINVNNSAFNQNFAGLVYNPSNIINVNSSQFLSNYVGIGYASTNNLNSQTNTFLDNLYDTTDLSTFPYSVDCNYAPPPLVIPPQLSVKSQDTFTLDCVGDQTDGYSRNLPNGDLVEIYCPVSGDARIVRLDSTTLPADLPNGYTYASAFQVEITQNDEPINIIDEGGYIRASFIASYLQSGSSYEILYWDAWEVEDGKLVQLETGKWVPLKDFILQAKGPRSFYLDPETENMVERKIISGVRLLSKSTDKRVDVTINFPGIFVLAQQ